MNYLGKHTTIAYLSKSEWSQISYLKDNNGALPPFVIAMGDARRLELACEVLGLKDVVRLHEEGERLLGLKGKGRIDIIIGTYEQDGKSFPLTLVETQMGMPATEINLREVCSHVSLSYKLKNKTISTDSIYLLRVGTAGGINNPASPETNLKVGDIVNATFGLGWSGTLFESLAGLDFSSQDLMKKFRDKWKTLGHGFTEDQKYPVGKSSEKLVQVINQAATELNINCIEGGNFSKDSLYGEMDEEMFIELCKKYGVRSTEMEQMAVLKLTSDFKSQDTQLNTGLISGVIGTIPGESFAKEYEHVERDTLKVAARALWKVAYK